MSSVLLQESEERSSSVSPEMISTAHCSLDSADLRKKHLSNPGLFFFFFLVIHELWNFGFSCIEKNITPGHKVAYFAMKTRLRFCRHLHELNIHHIKFIL